MIFSVSPTDSTTNNISHKSDTSWPKTLPSFQITCLSTVNNKFSYQVGTPLLLEPEFKQNTAHKKAQVLIRGKNEDFPARCRVYQQEGANQNQRVFISVHLSLVLHRSY